MVHPHTISVDVQEARERFDELLEHVEAGGEVLLTLDGAPVARLVPHRREDVRERIQLASARLRSRRTSMNLRGLKLRDRIDERRE